MAEEAGILPHKDAANQFATPVSCRLLELRAAKQAKDAGIGVLELAKTARRNWERLAAESKERTRRQSQSQVNNLLGRRKRSCTEEDSNEPAQCLPVVATPSPKKKLKARTYCARAGCNVNDANSPRMKFHQITKLPAPLKPNATKKQYIKREGKIILRKETLDRCSFKRNAAGGRLFVCEKHNFEFVTKHKELNWTNKDGTEEKWTQQWVLYVPKGEGPASKMNIATTREST